MQRDQTLISVTNILTTGDVASVSSYAAGEFSLATTVNALKNKALPTLANGMLRYNGSAWVFDGTAYAPIASPTFSGVVTLPVATGLLKATSGVVSIAGAGDLPGGPYLPLAGGTMTGSITSPTPNNILNPTTYQYLPNTSSPFSQGITNYSSHDWSAYTAPTQETTVDGTTWVSATLSTKLFDAYPSPTSVQVINMATPLFGTRWTWNNVTYSYITKALITYSYTGVIPTGFTQTVETSPDGVTWTNVGTSAGYDSTIPTIFSFPTVGANPWLRITVKATGGTGTVSANAVQLWTNRLGDQGKSKWNYLPFSWDYNKKLIANTVNADQAYIGKWVDNATYARMGHLSYNTSTGFGYMQTSDGRVFTASNTSVTVRIGAADLLTTTSAGNTLLGTTTIGTLNGILKATLGIVSVASSSDLPGGPYLPLAGGTLNTGSQILTNKDITPSASANTNYSQTPLVAQRATNTGTTTVAGVGFHNSGVNAAALYYDAALSIFKYNRHTGDIVTIWDSSNFTPGAYLPLAGGTMTGRILSTVSGFNSYDSAIVLNSADPSIFFSSTSAGTNNKKWRIRCTSGVWRIDSYDDAESNAESPFEVQRTSGSSVINNMYLRSAAINLIGATTISTLVGTGTRLTTVSSTGVLGATSFINDGPWLPVSGGVVTGSTTFSAGLTTSSLYASGTTILAGGINGVTDGSSAASGKVGEILSASASGAVFSGTTAGVSLVSLSLPAGAWLVWGCAHISNGQSPLSLRVFLSYSSTGTSYIDSNTSFSLGIPVASSGITCHNAPTPINRSSTATVYLIGSEITTGTAATNNGASIFAQRIR